MVEPANSRQQTNTEILMDCQTELKLLIKQALYDVRVMATFESRKRKIIEEAVEQIDDMDLRQTAERTLSDFADREYKAMISMLGLGNLPLVLAFAGRDLIKAIDRNEAQKEINKKIVSLGVGKINKAFSQLGNSQAKVSYGQSLYGHSELRARYNEQQDMLNKLKARTKLVICDTHSDCSDRCFHWQGRVYSLDGTSGTTSDGRKYIPLEVATNAEFKGHRNGLLGYNCRHKLVAYEKGLKPVKVSKAEQERESKISNYQRLLEREIRQTKDLALSFKGENADKYNYYRERVMTLTAEYKEFCQKNNRVEYRSRLQI